MWGVALSSKSHSWSCICDGYALFSVMIFSKTYKTPKYPRVASKRKKSPLPLQPRCGARHGGVTPKGHIRLRDGWKPDSQPISKRAIGATPVWPVVRNVKNLVSKFSMLLNMHGLRMQPRKSFENLTALRFFSDCSVLLCWVCADVCFASDLEELYSQN